MQLWDTNNYMTDTFCTVNNLRSENTEISPSGRFKIIISKYGTREGCWNYTKGIIIRISDDKVITEIFRNYLGFHHSFFTRIGESGVVHEWLCTGRTYLSQCFVNLDTGDIYDNSKDKNINNSSLCWIKIVAMFDQRSNITEIKLCLGTTLL